MKALTALLTMKKALYIGAAIAVLVGGTGVNAATGGRLLEPITGAPPAAPTPIPSIVVASPTVTRTARTPGPGLTPTVASRARSTTAANSETFDTSSPSNIVQVINQTDNALRVEGRVQLNHIPGPDASPFNEAYAYSSCTGCQTLAVALQINLISKSATTIQPQNVAIALNYHCTGCTTIAKALQYNISVADPNQVPGSVSQLIGDMQGQLGGLQGAHVSASAAESRINALLLAFSALAQSLNERRRVDTNGTDPDAHAPAATTPTPTSTATAPVPTSPPPTPSATPTAEETATPSPTVETPTPTGTPTPTPTPTG